MTVDDLPLLLRTFLAPSLCRGLVTTLEQNGGLRHWSSVLGAAVLMFLEADVDTRVRFMVRARSRLMVEGGNLFGDCTMTREDARFYLDVLGDVDLDGNPHLLTDGREALTRLFFQLDDERIRRQSAGQAGGESVPT